MGIWGVRHRCLYVLFYRVMFRFLIYAPCAFYYAPFARFYALCGTFTHLTQPYAPCATSSRAFSLHIAPLRNIRNRAHLCAPFTHPDRPGSVLVYILAIGLLVVTCRSRDSFGSVDWSEVSRPVPVSFCAPCLRQVSLFYAGSRGGQSTS